MSSHTNGENFVSTGYAVAEKTEKINMDGLRTFRRMDERHENIMPPATLLAEANKLHLFPLWSTCHVPSFNFFLGVVSEIQRSKVFHFFQHGFSTT